MVRIVMVGYQYRPTLLRAVKRVNQITNNVLKFAFFNTYDVDNGKVSPEEFVKTLNEADMILIDVRGGDNVSRLIVNTLRGVKDKTIITLVGGSPELINLTRMGCFSLSKFTTLSKKPVIKHIFKRKTIDYGKIVKMREKFEKLGSILPFSVFKHAKNYAFILKCYENPSEENYTAMLLLLLREYGKVKLNVKIPEPKIMPTMGVLDFHTNRIFNSVDDYLAAYKYSDRPLIGILFYGGHHYDQSLPAAKLLTYKLEEAGLGVIPVFCSDLRYYLAIEKFFIKRNKPIIETAIDLLWFRFAGGPLGGDHRITLETLTKLNVPVLHGVQLSSITIEEWDKSRMGVPPIEMVTTVILPELDGRIEPHVTHGLKRYRSKNIQLEDYVAIDDRISKLARRTAKWVNLRRKPNREKKVAIIIYNYPPGEENLGKVAYLDVFASISKLLNRMKEEGYLIDRVPDKQELKELLLRSGAVNSGEWIHTPKVVKKMYRVDIREYLEWFKALPKDVQKRVIEEWGDPPGNIMTYDGFILIPGITINNVFIGVQSSRGVHEDPSKIYHKRDLPPHHQYIAFYKWIERKFEADAIIHFGTHGTLEFLPGKDTGLSNRCFPDILIGDIPNIYIYHIVNSSEAAIAKHRSYAVMIGHSSPPLTVSGSHDFILELERLINQYYDTLQYSKDRALELLKKITSMAREYGLGENIDEIHDRIYEYKRSLIPKGLHILGVEPSDEELVDYLTFITRYDRGYIKSLHRIIAESLNLNYDELLEHPSKTTRNGKMFSRVLENIECMVKKIIELHIVRGMSVMDTIKSVPIEGANLEDLTTTLNYLKQVKENILASNELENILHALNGEYIMPGPGGDPIRTPEVFPTGRNIYQLDPTNIPTEIAMERGSRIAEEYIRRYYQQHGRYPRVVSVVLWGFETMKTGGETIAAILRLLGVKPIWKSIYIRDLEVIPLEELRRPRIDVLVTICGIFRDTFYNIVELLDRAFKLIANLDEPLEWNYVKANILSDRSKLGEDSILRIFGPPEGEYATPLTNVIESSIWRSEVELVQAYLNSMRYAYGVNVRGYKAESVLKTLLSRVDIVTQIRDSIDYEITDLDHYYEFLGGLTKSVEEVRGVKPLVLVADTTRERVKVEHVSEAIRRGVVTRLLNPKWIGEMLKHGYNGVTKIADRVEYLLGLAATVGYVENWMWNGIVEKIVFKKEVYNVMRKENPWALQKIIKRLLEANVRGYWHTSRDIIEKLKEKYLEIEGLLEEATS